MGFINMEKVESGWTDLWASLVASAEFFIHSKLRDYTRNIPDTHS